MEEMIDDTLAMEDDEELEEEADAEVDKVLYDLTEGKLGQAGTVKEDLPVRPQHLIVALRSNLCLVIAGPSGGRRNGTSDGAIPATAEWATEWVITDCVSGAGASLCFVGDLYPSIVFVR